MRQNEQMNELKRRASSLQLLNKSIAGHPVFLSPMRDLAVMFPVYLAYTFVGAIQDLELRELRGDPEAGGLSDQLVRLTERLSRFVERCTGYEAVTDVHDLSEQVGLPDRELEAAESLLGRQLLRVLLGAYHQGVRDSLKKGEDPLNREMLWAYVERYAHLRKEQTDAI